MPVQPTYPGVYIEEIPSGVRTITGVATSITAFIGRALRGPTDAAVTINSYADFERIFGGLWVDSSLGYAVRDFYLNGGSQAIVIRLYHVETGTSAKPAKATLDANGLPLEAAYAGKWGNTLRARIDHNTRPKPDGTDDADLFNLTVRDGETGEIEVFRNVSVVPNHTRQVDKVLMNESRLVRMEGTALPSYALLAWELQFSRIKNLVELGFASTKFSDDFGQGIRKRRSAARGHCAARLLACAPAGQRQRRRHRPILGA